MRTLLTLFKKSVLITGAIALVLTLTVSYLWATSGSIPYRLWEAYLVVLAYFFGGKLPDIIETLLDRSDADAGG